MKTYYKIYFFQFAVFQDYCFLLEVFYYSDYWITLIYQDFESFHC